MTEQQAFYQELVAAVPRLRAFAISLAGSRDRADDLVQETMLKGWKNRAQFQPGTNLKAWLFTILRNEFYSQVRRKREVEDADGAYVNSVSVPPEQQGHLEFQDLKTALQKLPDDQREAIILVGASGFSYEEAAQICEVAVGTIKSRVNRARAKLGELLSVE